jgi:hypothetical protein
MRTDVCTLPYNISKPFFLHADDSEDDSDYDYDDDDDDDDDDGGAFDEDGNPRGGIVMSANLMRALGMDTSHIDTETDWKPPERSGLEHSDAIFSVKK